MLLERRHGRRGHADEAVVVVHVLAGHGELGADDVAARRRVPRIEVTRSRVRLAVTHAPVFARRAAGLVRVEVDATARAVGGRFALLIVDRAVDPGPDAEHLVTRRARRAVDVLLVVELRGELRARRAR